MINVSISSVIKPSPGYQFMNVIRCLINRLDGYNAPDTRLISPMHDYVDVVIMGTRSMGRASENRAGGGC